MPVMPCSSRLSGELVGVIEEAVEIFVGSVVAGIAGTPVVDRLLRFVADIAIAGAGVVGADGVA